MIDVHCHILPLVDDGPTSFDEAMKMVDMAYADGTKCIIATPHRNHPFEFVPTETIESTYKKLRELIQLKYNDFGIVLGAELYITKDYLTLIKSKPYDFTIRGTNYVLIEFDREILYKDMLDVVHELIIRGYRPIIAHIEMYPHLTSNVEKVRSIRNEGAYIQITASSITGKHGNELSVYLRKLIRLGLVDFVASDGHKIDMRRPRLSEAYRTISGMLSEKDADRIFKHNPKALIAGNHITQPTYAIKSGGSKIVRMNMIAASIAILLIAVATLFSMFGRNDAITAADDAFGLEVSEKLVLETTEASTESGDPNTSLEATSTTNQSTGISTSNTTSSSTSSSPTIEAIEEGYINAMKSLESKYVSELEAIVANIKVAKENISDDEQRKAIIDAYIDEIVLLEQQSDNIVYDLLYKMQNDLEAQKYDVSRVRELREAYHAVKETKQAEYLGEFGY